MTSHLSSNHQSSSSKFANGLKRYDSKILSFNFLLIYNKRVKTSFLFVENHTKKVYPKVIMFSIMKAAPKFKELKRQMMRWK